MFGFVFWVLILGLSVVEVWCLCSVYGFSYLEIWVFGWRWVSTKIWGFRGSFGTKEEEQTLSTIAHKTEKEKELTSRNQVGCLQAMGLRDIKAKV